MTKDLRVALVGYGVGGRFFHAPYLVTTPGVRLAAVVTNDPRRRAQVSKEYPEAELFQSANELWARSADFDVAVITTTNRTHLPLGRAAMQAGLHTVIDKPIAINVAEGRLLAETAAQTRRLLVPYHNRRFDGDFLTVRELLALRQLGTVHRFESRWETWRRQPDQSRWRESTDPADGGGLLLDLGSHLVDQALLLFGDVKAVHGEVRTVRSDGGADDDVFIALQHVSGTISHLWAGHLVADRGPRFRVLGDSGAFTVYGMDPQEVALRAGKRPEALWGIDPKRTGSIVTEKGSESVPITPGDARRFWRLLAAAVREGAPSPVDVNDAIRGLEVLDHVRRVAFQLSSRPPSPN
jgi:scyllo-inositol 2-dehydrogenase (NADP+)